MVLLSIDLEVNRGVVACRVRVTVLDGSVEIIMLPLKMSLVKKTLLCNLATLISARAWFTSLTMLCSRLRARGCLDRIFRRVKVTVAVLMVLT